MSIKCVIGEIEFTKVVRDHRPVIYRAVAYVKHAPTGTVEDIIEADKLSTIIRVIKNKITRSDWVISDDLFYCVKDQKIRYYKTPAIMEKHTQIILDKIYPN